MSTTSHEPSEFFVETGLHYRAGEPVVVHVRRRDPRVDLDDHGTAVRWAGRPAGWLGVVEKVVAAEGLNVNRRGVVFVPAVLGRDLDALAEKVARTSRAAYLALLDLDERV